MERDFDPADNFPSVVMDALQRMMTALGQKPPNVRIKPGAANTLYVPAGEGDAAAGLIIEGKWRWNEDPSTSEVAGSGSAGERDVWACAGASDYQAGSPGESDETDRSFVLQITDVDDDPPNGFDHARRVARALWSGTVWLDVVPFVGDELYFGDVKPGDMKPWPFSWEPIGWKFCDGATLDSESTLRDLLLADSGKFGMDDADPLLPDLAGRVPVGVDGAANRIPSNDGLGQSGGAATHTLTTAQLPAHAHGPANTTHFVGANGTVSTLNLFLSQIGGGSDPVATRNAGSNPFFASMASTANAGSGEAHNNLQPYLVVNWLIKT